MGLRRDETDWPYLLSQAERERERGGDNVERVDDSGGDVTRSRFGIGDDDDDRSRVERTGERACGEERVPIGRRRPSDMPESKSYYE